MKTFLWPDRIRRASLGLVLVAVLLPGQGGQAQNGGYKVKTEIGVMVPLRDGVKLATNIFRPDAEGKFPVVMERTPYGRVEAQQLAQVLATLGYACVWQDVRGRFDSEGAWEPFHYETEDGHDAVEWAAKQPWSSGKVVMFGGSYAAGTQWLAAKGRSPHLVGLIPFVSPGDIHDSVWVDGAFSLGVLQTWAALMEKKSFTGADFVAFEKLPWSEVFSHLPVAEALPLIDRDPFFYRKWIDHPFPDDYWKGMSWQQDPPDVAALHVTGWFDIFQRDTIRNYEVMRKGAAEPARSRQRLIVGPWAHQGTGTKVGDVDFGEAAALEVMGAEVVPFIKQCIEDADPTRKPVKVFTMGENRWHEYDDWPVPGSEEVEYFLGSGKGANSSAGDGSLDTGKPGADESFDRYTYDPRDPVPNRGGGNCCWPQILPWGPLDQSEIEERRDVLVYSTPPLAADVRVTGPVQVVLHISSSALDTDFTAKLVDVDPEGFAMNLTDGILRTRYRNSRTEPQLLEKDAVTELRIDLGYTSNLFRKGHRIRLEISSSNFPRFSRNTNTGGLPELDEEMTVAEQTVFHDARRPSRLVVRVVR